MNEKDINELYRQQRSNLIAKIERYKREIQEDEKKVKALEVLIGEGNYSIVTDHSDSSEEYPFNGTYIEKIKYVLRKNGKATAREITDEIIKTEKITSKESINRVHLNVTLNSSTLYGKGVLDAEKIGNAHHYSLAD